MQASHIVDDARARKRDLARIHMLSAELGLSDDEYRDVMASVCAGIRSSALLDVTNRQKLIDHFESTARRINPNRRAGNINVRATVKKTLSTRQKLMWSLWMQAADKGMVEQRKMSALNTWLQRQTGVARIEWLTPAQEVLAIESLKKWVGRRV